MWVRRGLPVSEKHHCVSGKLPSTPRRGPSDTGFPGTPHFVPGGRVGGRVQSLGSFDSILSEVQSGRAGSTGGSSQRPTYSACRVLRSDSDPSLSWLFGETSSTPQGRKGRQQNCFLCETNLFTFCRDRPLEGGQSFTGPTDVLVTDHPLPLSFRRHPPVRPRHSAVQSVTLQTVVHTALLTGTVDPG